MDVAQYLNRIGFGDAPRTDAATLQKLHEHHVRAVPFEDLDIHLGNTIRLDLEHLYKKVVRQHRGGFCYELNTLFCQLLRALGFDCWLVASRIYDEAGVLGPPFDHMSIVVQLADQWLVDVGYGDLFLQPQRIALGQPRRDRTKYYQITLDENAGYVLHESINGQAYTPQYLFELQPQPLEAFAEQCAQKQVASDSYFVNNLICTLPTARGRITLKNGKVICREQGQKREVPLASAADLERVLRDAFGLSLAPVHLRSLSKALIVSPESAI